MGFRDINAFNLVMLAKQAWRLIQGTLSLFYRVYKVKYFPTCSFMEVELGHNPFYVWRSLLRARELLQEGFVWRVGDCCTIGIQSHKWLPHPSLFWDGVDQLLKVCDFINPYTKQWDRGKINAQFVPLLRDEVLEFALGIWNRVIYYAGIRISPRHSRCELHIR